MEIDITGRHFEVGEALKETVTEKVGKLVKYAPKLEHAHVVLEVQKFRHIAEITLRGKNLRTTAKEESGDMYSAFDKCLGTAQLQLRRQHEKNKDHKARRYDVEGAPKRV